MCVHTSASLCPVACMWFSGVTHACIAWSMRVLFGNPFGAFVEFIETCVVQHADPAVMIRLFERAWQWRFAAELEQSCIICAHMIASPLRFTQSLHVSACVSAWCYRLRCAQSGWVERSCVHWGVPCVIWSLRCHLHCYWFDVSNMVVASWSLALYASCVACCPAWCELCDS